MAKKLRDSYVPPTPYRTGLLAPLALRPCAADRQPIGFGNGVICDLGRGSLQHINRPPSEPVKGDVSPLCVGLLTDRHRKEA